jgi:tetratricopeptide (TPR) repeat protein
MQKSGFCTPRNVNPRTPLPGTWYLVRRTQYNRDHALDASHSFQRCLELRPRDILAEYNLGLAYEKLQKPAEAIRAYQTAITWESGDKKQDPQPYLDLGTLLLHEGKAAEAIGPMTQAVGFDPHNALANQELGLALERLERYGEAVLALQRAAALAPKRSSHTSFSAASFATLDGPRMLRRNTPLSRSYSPLTLILRLPIRTGDHEFRSVIETFCGKCNYSLQRCV